MNRGPAVWNGQGDASRVFRSSLGHDMMLPAAAEGTVVARSFRGSPEETAQDAAEYLTAVTPLGWAEVSRTYTPGSWGCGAFLAALVLAIVLIGILIFIYLVVVKPPGMLVVTYTRPAHPISSSHTIRPEA